jgi:hypothetical protein
MQTEIMQVLTDKWQKTIEIHQKLEDPPSLNATQRSLRGLRRSNLVAYQEIKRKKGFEYKRKK